MDDLSIPSAFIGAGCVCVLWGCELFAAPYFSHPVHRRLSGILILGLAAVLFLIGTAVPMPVKSSQRPVERSAADPTSDRTSIGPSVPRRL